LTEPQVRSGIDWKPLVAAALSFLFAGLGHLYLRRYARGSVFLVMAIFLYRISGYSPRAEMLNVILFVFAAFDAYSYGKRGHGIV
jgi:TM2 domain-containing membrane protein YozV